MRDFLRSVFSPVLKPFESGQEPFEYKPSQRLVLLIVGVLFTGLGSGVFFVARGEDPLYFLPVLVFGAAGLLSLIVGSLGTDRGVARIWGTKKR